MMSIGIGKKKKKIRNLIKRLYLFIEFWIFFLILCMLFKFYSFPLDSYKPIHIVYKHSWIKKWCIEILKRKVSKVRVLIPRW